MKPTRSMIIGGTYSHGSFRSRYSPFTAISFDLPGEKKVSLRIFDASGKLVRILVEKAMPAGWHSVVWDGTNDSGNRVSAGVYFYRFEAGEYMATKKLLLVQ